MFSKKDSFVQENERAEKEAISSIIDTKMVIKGELLFEGKARIDGSIEGNIKGEHLILSEGGKITGDVQVSTFVCHGALEGNIKASMLTARKTSRIHGSIQSNNLIVEPGARLEGEVKVATKDLHLVSDENNSTKTLNRTANS
jgi:cytoskeletal protein CcmA (bactofilin family)